MVRRVFGALRLDPAVYRELRDDPTATVPALLFVVLCVLAAGVVALPSGGLPAFGLAAASAFISWTIFVVAAYVFGTKALPGPDTQATLGTLVRTLGLALAPSLLLVFGVVPALQVVVVPLAFVWTVFTTLMALRETLGVGTLRALLVAVLSYAAAAIVGSLLPPPGMTG
ncbi:MAG: YIP1 family protein [Thermomicrobium sp.]|nr:YIP1 family protein [Thermomicrobium sp.]